MHQILLLCGGGGSEHDISLKSAEYLAAKLSSLDNVILHQAVLQPDRWETPEGRPCTLSSSRQFTVQGGEGTVIDYAVPCIHGCPGETGDIQSFFEIIGLPYLGCPPEGNRLCFNKVSTKLWLSGLDVPNTPYVFLPVNSPASHARAFQAMRKWGCVFVKAASQGSSVGCYRVDELKDLEKAVNDAFRYSSQVLVEKAEKARELEVAVYEFRGELVATKPGEILTSGSGFYSFDEKYSATSSTGTAVEAGDLTAEQQEKIRDYALRAFRGLGLRDLSRVDFFLTAEGEILLNEINTFPGMTPISMFPKMMEHRGDSMAEYLSDRIASTLKNR